MNIVEALASLVRVTETGSFSAVARERDVSKAAVARRISHLEQHFGVRLLHRTTRKLSLTNDGVDAAGPRQAHMPTQRATALGKGRGRTERRRHQKFWRDFAREILRCKGLGDLKLISLTDCQCRFSAAQTDESSCFDGDFRPLVEAFQRCGVL